MPIQLDKIVAAIIQEQALHPHNRDASKKEIDDAWARVSKKNNLSLHEARSIFKVLQKKYEEERLKIASTWKLFSMMEQLHRKDEKEIKQEIKEELNASTDMDEDEQYEMFEVNDELLDEDNLPAAASSTASSSDSAAETNSEENKAETIVLNKPTPAATATAAAVVREEKKVLNPMARSNALPQVAAAMNKKGITMKKAITGANTNKSINVVAAAGTSKAAAKSIMLPESLKRKLSEEHNATQQKKLATSPNVSKTATATATTATANSSSANQQQQLQQQQQPHTTTTQLMQVKKEREEQNNAAGMHGINLITIPGNAQLVNGLNGLTGGTSSTAATVASTSTNGDAFSPRIEDIDFRNDVIFDNAGDLNGTAGGGCNTTLSRSNRLNAQNDNIISMDSLDGGGGVAMLPANFLKNLCNPERHEALGVYVANIMNRLRPRAATRLETRILRAILDTQSEELEQ